MTIQIPVKVDAQTQLALKTLQSQLTAMSKAAATAFNTASGIGNQNASAISNILSQIAEIEAQINAIEMAINITYTATQTIGADSVVYEITPGSIAIAAASVLATANAIVGITQSPATIGSKVIVAGSGSNLTNPAWNWTVGPVFLGLNGMMTQTPGSTSGAVFLAPIGYATSPTTVLVMLGEPEYFTITNTDAVLGRSASGLLDQQWLPLLPSLNEIPAGKTVTVPAFCNLLTIKSAGLRIDGGLILAGGMKEL